MPHSFRLRVYYEDTDLAGIVYYANYLKFIERGRSEWLRELGVEQSAMKAETGEVFAVRRIEADYLRPARFDEMLEVRTDVAQITPARLVLSQQVMRGDDLLFTARVTIACLAPDGRPARIPVRVMDALRGGGVI
ncbi:tol-pal system-associated acyl-CoA thioesterase [Paracoccus siganidrum]|uniref:Tol-pal system-associated acyl-CoA thioesterase n=1 Tax=Paracoccus siganidrum TaxID=1276757 RepID=A0A419A3H0_9RHOB|nr:tol-pal system-associated acyl-CoA thioesterase [Paracoccus siganidrum]RJL07898.1 tol-pal system-associated acyl-CoA thioesterase [Paracoccus siganidrum]RMC34032.1 tol-pal system-associated acyl-CoA thioesterase [Paracoccus siganidrum]